MSTGVRRTGGKMEPLFGRDYTTNRRNTTNLTDDYNTIGEELAQAQRELFDWDECYQEGLSSTNSG